MELWLNFSVSILGIITWPLCILIISIIYRESISQILSRIKSANIGGVSVNLAEINAINDRITKSPKLYTVSVTSGQIYSDTVKIAMISPAAAVLYAYSQLEKIIKEKLKSIDPSVNTYLVNNMPRLLFKNNEIDQETFNALNDMRKIRNAAGHEGLDIETKAAEEYGKNVELLINIINS